MSFRVIALLALLPFAASSQSVTPPLLAPQSQHGFSMVIAPPLPAALDFAGERVPLENFDTRESLERELSVTAYMHSRSLITLLNTTRYMPIIEPILVKNGIPLDMKYLCVAESGLNPNIVSVAGAAGLWQFMTAAGKGAGLEINSKIDERYHVEKATQAACNYLRDAYKRFGSWTLAAAAYNMGNAGLAKRMELQKITNYYDLFLPEETMRYVFRILSWKLVTEHPARYGFIIDSTQYHRPFERFKEVEIRGQKIDWPAEAARNGTSYKMLRELNQWIRDYDWDNPSGKAYKVKMPQKNFRE
ncbi:MAG: transglycosylase SLT domain-containing protein [Rikenellaceae bacterium]|jgi:hypothetical protein|nr:transglycosylase SLT domain-containing protein [Rikenellaceae bacterium]